MCPAHVLGHSRNTRGRFCRVVSADPVSDRHSGAFTISAQYTLAQPQLVSGCASTALVSINDSSGC